MFIFFEEADEKKWFGDCSLLPGCDSPIIIDKDIPCLKDVMQGKYKYIELQAETQIPS